MKAIIPRIELVTLIGKIQNVVPQKPTLPILGNILLEARDDQLILSATDLTVSMRAHTDAKVLEEGAMTLPARRFFQLVRELTAPQVELHAASPEIAFINSGTSHFKINGMHRSEFPALPDLTEGAHFSLPSPVLKEMLGRTLFAAARDDNRQMLNGIHLEYGNKMATFTATDGKRIAKLQTTIDLGDTASASYILPVKAVEEIIKILDAKEGTCKFSLMNDKIALEMGSMTLISKLISGKYPDLGQIIPLKKETSISLHREELMSLLRQVSLFTSDNNAAVRFTFAPGELHLAAMSGEIGEGRVNMPVNYGGERIDIAFNPHYFLDILRHSKDESVHFDMTDPYNPGLITDSSSAVFVIMPMRLEAGAGAS